MEAERLNQWLNLAATFGVIAGIAFLIVELDQTNRIARYTVEIGWRSQAIEINSSRIEYSETFAKLQADEAELTPSERAQALMMARRNRRSLGYGASHPLRPRISSQLVTGP